MAATPRPPAVSLAVAPEIPPEIRDFLFSLAALERAPGSPGEAEAAERIAERLRQAGCRVEVDEVPFHAGYAKLIGTLTGTATGAGLLALRGGRMGRRLGVAVAALAGLAIADDVSNGPRVVRRSRPAQQTQNVIGVCGDTAAERTLVVMAHHDAAPTGAIFDDGAQRWVGERLPGLIERTDTSLPLWWAVLSGPLLVAAGARSQRRNLIRAGTAAAALATAAFADIARSPTVPGANDNLSGVAVLVALAERFAQAPPQGLRVMLVCCGAEEVIQGGVHGFAERRFPELGRDRTWFLNLDSVGSPRLALVEGEGPVVMEDYFDRSFRDLVVRAAEAAGAPVRRGLRARSSTDAVIPSRAGYPTATLVSVDRYKAISNYHKPSDTPENLDWRTVAHAELVSAAVARELAGNPWVGPSGAPPSESAGS
jgi:hypothetical protein